MAGADVAKVETEYRGAAFSVYYEHGSLDDDSLDAVEIIHAETMVPLDRGDKRWSAIERAALRSFREEERELEEWEDY